MKKFLKSILIIGITLIALAMLNIISYAVDDDGIPELTPGDLLTPTQSTTTTTTTTAPTTTTTTTIITPTTTTTTSKTTRTTNTTTLPHTGIEDSTGTIVAIVALAVVGISSFVVIKKNSDI